MVISQKAYGFECEVVSLIVRCTRALFVHVPRVSVSDVNTVTRARVCVVLVVVDLTR